MEKPVKKPKLWNIAILTGLLAAVLFFLVYGEESVPLDQVCVAMFLYLLLALLCLVFAFFQQLKYNLYSYNTAYYFGYFLFVLFLVISHGIIMIQVFRSPDSFTIFQVLVNLSDSIRLFIALSLTFLLVFAIALFASNILQMKKHGVYHHFRLHA